MSRQSGRRNHPKQRQRPLSTSPDSVEGVVEAGSWFIPKVRRRNKMRNRKPGEAIKIPPELIESYRSLRSAVTFLGADEPLKVVQVVSAVPSEGKSTTVTNLAHVTSQSGVRSSLHETFGLFSDVSLSNVLDGEVGMTSAAKTLSNDGDLPVLTAGPTTPNAADLRRSWRAKDVFGTTRPHSDVILVDGPPLLTVNDPIVFGQFVDAVLVVVRSKKSRKREVGSAFDLLHRSQRNVIGVVINSTHRRRLLGLGGYNYGYRKGAYAHGEYGKNPRRRRKITQPTTSAVQAWVPDERPMWTAPLGPGWSSDHEIAERDELYRVYDSQTAGRATGPLSSISPVVRAPNNAGVLTAPKPLNCNQTALTANHREWE